MAIDFSAARWDRIKESYTAWWNGTLGRPLIPVWIRHQDPGMPRMSFEHYANLSISAEELINRVDRELSCYTYRGDAFPFLQMMYFGAGITAGFLGAKVLATPDTVWLCPEKILPIEALHFEFTEDNIWLERINDIYRAGKKRWGGQVLMTMPDLGGVLDLLSVFRPGELLFLDLYDAPEEVERIENELWDIWMRYHAYFADIIGRDQGYCDWAEIWSPTPSYTLQCDASYMLSPEMFAQFAMPRLRRGIQDIPHSTYHLDGVGQIPHLELMLSTNELDVLQWVPGDGKPPQGEWPDIYRSIAKSGKKTQVIHGIDSFRQIGKIMGGFERLHMIRSIISPDTWPEYQRLLDEFNVPV